MRNSMKKRGSALGRALPFLALLAMGLVSTACDFLDPTDVENPRTTDEDLAQADEPTAALVPGLEAQFARMLDATVVSTACASDNYQINGTGIDNSWDSPADITPQVSNTTSYVTGAYWHAQELKALANFVIDEIIPEDPTATPEDIATAHYYRGMAFLHLGENFSYAPLEEDGVPIPASQFLELAVADLNQAAPSGGSLALAAQAALARTYRWQGNRTAAASAANQVLSSDPEFLYQQGFDANSIDNAPYWYLVGRALQEMQPAPRVDFLDPKYFTKDDDMPVAKAEEMHLILAEIALAGSNYETAKGHLGDAIRLAKSRPTIEWIDDDARSNADLSIRPRDSEILVRADADSPYRAGLVQDRFGGTTTQYVVSGTSLNADSVEALPSGDPDAIWHSLWLARQEILFLEGRRMADLGIRLPMMRREIDQNPNLTYDPSNPGPGEAPVVPSYIPPFGSYDLFTPASPYDVDGNLLTTEVTMQYDMNKILVQNNVSPFM
ncbi:MAG: hypothetical protein PVJ76_18940 [Gemmatimonadota bacterium]|jgi:tetratricopeptide (TPR) repeat protein